MEGEKINENNIEIEATERTPGKGEELPNS